MNADPIKGFTVDPSSIGFVGSALQRPECILAERDGTLWSADARGGVMRIAPGGEQVLLAQNYGHALPKAGDEVSRLTTGTLPNGLAFSAKGDFLVANFGTDALEIMDRSGETQTLFDTIDGIPIGKVNFVIRDSRDRIWITVSTRIKDWMRAMRPGIADGYIILVEPGRPPRIVADGLRFTNEIRLDAREEYLYAVETTGQRIVRMRVRDDGALGPSEIFGPSKLGRGGFPDGIAFDAAGNLWGTLIMSDVIFAIDPDGNYHELLVDGDEARTAALEAAFQAGSLTPEIMLAASGRIAPWFASVTFGGADLRTVYIGSLRGEHIPFFRSPVPGLPMQHWNETWPVSPLRTGAC